MSSIEQFDSKEAIQQAYWGIRLQEGKTPVSVYQVCEKAGVEEAIFYQHYSSLAALEGDFWKSTVSETVAVLEADEDFSDYDFEQKLLAFYYTYFVHIQKHRSRFVECFPKMSLEGMKALKGMREEFCQFAKILLEQGKAESIIADRKKLNELYDRGLFEQFKVLILFYRHDDSEKFQDTDAFIEKSVALMIEGVKSGMLDLTFDMARFLMRKTSFLKK